MDRDSKRRIRLEDVLKEENTLEKAYLAGYLIGYGGHSEWSGWVRELRQDVYSRAGSENLLDEARMAYLRGKREGMDARYRDIQRGIYRVSKFEKVRMRRLTERFALFEGLGEGGTYRRPRFLRLGRLGNSLGMLRRSYAGLPRFLRR
ncbi:hypothetical protein APY94_06265 [Thermococcus celericrescens]|uniref:Uncharacterized protein n=1 Tax=Thermococcus celericrescens TaxID=227598 RepID=A0A124EBC1_9EURY|nr:hypothetical protein [Thermococcus celericrescens]KUH33337.1 hypothetical protein APY94_06265 [Thermococcus celericrescens]